MQHRWPRVLAGGVLWTAVYVLVWGVAWFAFMRSEWLEAMAALNRPLPWVFESWILWLALSLPTGILIMAYAASRARSAPAPRTALHAGLAVWVLMTMGMAGWGWQDLLSIRIIVLDSIVNLVAMVAASLAGGWSQTPALARSPSIG